MKNYHCSKCENNSPASDGQTFAKALSIVSLTRAIALLLLFAPWPASPLGAQTTDKYLSDNSPSVGEPRQIEELFLPGTLLRARPLIDERQPIVLRIVNAFPQGTLGFRYELVYYGCEPGSFDLRDYLERVDRSSAADLPEIPVQIRTLLPPGQIEPNALPDQSIARLGGYRLWLSVAIVLWCAVFVAIVVFGRRRRADREQRESAQSLAELLRPRIQAAMEGKLDSRQNAELERMLIALWQRRLGLEDRPPSAVVSQIRQHPESGPLMRALEQWMHDPDSGRSVDLSSLLEPLSRLPAAALDGDREPINGDNAAKSVREASRA